ncbi:unnamed protein product [Brachionus calyciflorus]|uniref:Ubiquitin-like protease family profile domain-containing protein n=1 Tax=Brachionus calyciflorus TaxID=104777 RepID=A0A813VY89_9BILA|nr:unnamed protein product [Brachionus calyciflorus]
MPRTNNNIEGWHTALQNVIRRSPIIYVFIDKIKLEQANMEAIHLQLVTGRLPKRKASYVDEFTIFTTSNQLLSDSIIDAYITCIIDRSNTYLFNYFDAVKIAMKGDFGCNKRTTKLSDFRYIIGPVLYYKDWTLFFADTMERKFMYIDAMGKRNVQKVFENWSIYDDKPWKLHVVHHSIQKDSINCGVFVCKFTKMILSGASDLIFDTGLLNEIRTDIRKTIETNNDFKLI